MSLGKSNPLSEILNHTGKTAGLNSRTAKYFVANRNKKTYYLRVMNNYGTKHFPWNQWWVRLWVATTALNLLATPAQAQTSNQGGPLGGFVANLVQGLNLIIAFGFIAGCTMVIGGFLNARRDENWKMTVIYGVGVAGAVALMKAMFGLFAGTNNSSAYIGQF
jgi:TrbC/VIRB2 pilin